jgi:hypothetical protein
MKVWEAVLLLAALVLGVWGLVLSWIGRELRRAEERRLEDEDRAA